MWHGTHCCGVWVAIAKCVKAAGHSGTVEVQVLEVVGRCRRRMCGGLVMRLMVKELMLVGMMLQMLLIVAVICGCK